MKLKGEKRDHPDRQDDEENEDGLFHSSKDAGFEAALSMTLPILELGVCQRGKIRQFSTVFSDCSKAETCNLSRNLASI